MKKNKEKYLAYFRRRSGNKYPPLMRNTSYIRSFWNQYEDYENYLDVNQIFISLETK